jgi:outer membrane immunogenic protein
VTISLAWVDRTNFNGVHRAAPGRFLPPIFLPAFDTYQLSRTYKGRFVGKSYEYALGFLPGLYWKIEYRFGEFDRASNPLYLVAANLPTGFSYDSQTRTHTVRSELVFNWGGPVVAKY